MSKEITVEEAKYANQYGWSDVHPYEIIEVRTPRKIMIRCMDTELDPNFKCDTTVGGFSGHCNNNYAQSYTYFPNPKYPLKAIRLDKRGNWKDRSGQKYRLSLKPHKFYDYNF